MKNSNFNVGGSMILIQLMEEFGNSKLKFGTKKGTIYKSFWNALDALFLSIKVVIIIS